MRFLMFAAGVAAVRAVLAALVPGVQVSGEWLTVDAAAKRGLCLTEVRDMCGTAVCRSLRLENRGAMAVVVEELGWRRHGDDDGLSEAGVRVWLEGWQMATPCGVRTADDCDFVFNPYYLPFAVSTPRDYVKGEKGRFRAENAVMFRRPSDGQVTLWGFVTGSRNFGHFRLRLDQSGLKKLDVLCDVGAEIRPGKTFETDVLMETCGKGGESLLTRFADELGRRAGARKRFAPPIGWCSWYYYFHDVTLKDVQDNVSWFKVHRTNGFEKVEYIQTDDGYQRALGDWTETNGKFPGGIGRLASVCREGGFKAGLWLGPFMAEEGSRLLAEHPEWMIRGKDGKVLYPFGWREKHGVAVLDGTHPEVQAHFRRLFAEIRRQGFDYVKLDFLMLAGAVHGGVLHDRSATRAEALCRGLKAIREGFGDDGFILGCTTPLLQTVGLVDANRVTADITPCWDHGPGKDSDEGQTVPNVCRNVIGHAYMNGRLWINDPDTLIVREDKNALTQQEVELWVDAVRLTGGSLFLSDNFATLSPSRRRYVERVLSDMNRYRSEPADRWERTVSERWVTHKDGNQKGTCQFDFKRHVSSVEGRGMREQGTEGMRDEL